MDLFCYLQRYIPIDDNNSIIETDIFIPKIFTNNQKKTDFIVDSAKKFNEEIFNEDKEILRAFIKIYKMEINILILENSNKG